jgi:hypothetical protein
VVSLAAPLDSDDGTAPPMWRLWVGYAIIFAIPFFIVGLLAAFRPERRKR